MHATCPAIAAGFDVLNMGFLHALAEEGGSER